MLCKNCLKDFIITDVDRAFYNKLEVPAPTFCPDCRAQRRLSWRNERKLYQRFCALCNKSTIAIYHPKSPYVVYCQDCWWSDKWNVQDYGKDYDPTKPFFKQFAELMLAVPRISLINKEPENSEYCNFALRNKNSYLLFTSAECEDSFYTNRTWKSRNVCDCSGVLNGELCYEVVDSNDCYNCSHLQNCSNCADCFLGYSLRNCHNCFGCAGLVGADYQIFNEQYSEADYQNKLTELKNNLTANQARFNKVKEGVVRKYADAVKCVDCTGDALYACKNSHNCFEVKNLEDCNYIFNATAVKDGYDINNDDNSELVYEAVGGESNNRHRFNDICWFDSEITYCNLCFNSKYLFGCSGVKKGEYLILNKAYSPADYEKKMAEITLDMKKSGEWGEFFSLKLSPFAYNETMAADYFPLTREAALAVDAKWQDELPGTFGKETIKAADLPENISEIKDDIVKEVLACAKCKRNYKISPQELAFYRQMNLAVPKNCPECRMAARLSLHNPRKLYERVCQCEKIEHGHGASCSEKFLTAYSSDRPEKVYCEECYQREIY